METKFESPAAKAAQQAQAYSAHKVPLIGARLKEAREMAGLSLWQVEALGGCDHETLKALEKGGGGYIQLDLLLMLVSLYGVNLAWVMTGFNPDFDVTESVRSIDAAGNFSVEECVKLARLFEMTTGAGK